MTLVVNNLFPVSAGSESVQGEELSDHEHPREDAECPGLSGELKRRDITERAAGFWSVTVASLSDGVSNKIDS